MDEILTNDEIPENLKRLVRIMLRAFYAYDHSLILDILVRNRCIKEEDISQLCKFEKKQLRSVLNTLKQEKILKSKIRMEPTPDAEPDDNGKIPQTKYNYFFINYRTTVNIIKYKLHKMREKIESQERDNSNRASFICPTCKNSYTDLQVDQLLDPMSGKLFCTYCRSEVEEDASAGPKSDSRTLLAKFNTQIAPIYDALRDTENIEFTPTMTDPNPSFVEYLHRDKDEDLFVGTDGSGRGRGPGEGDDPHWKKSGGMGFSNEVEIVISTENEKEKEIVAKVQPDWLIKSTVVTNPLDDGANENTFKPITPVPGDWELDDLLKQTENIRPKPTIAPSAITAESSEEEFVDDDEDVPLTVQGQTYSYDEISSDPTLVERMTEEEQNAYQEYMTRMMAYM